MASTDVHAGDGHLGADSAMDRALRAVPSDPNQGVLDGTTTPPPWLEEPVRLNLGCGRDIREGWVNIDDVPQPGVDIVQNLDDPFLQLPFAPDSVDAFCASHLIEHLSNPLGLMAELWRIARPGAPMEIRCPYGSTDDADEDPTHKRRMFPGSFGYFGQPFYWRADYGYRGDWATDRIDLAVSVTNCVRKADGAIDLDALYERVTHERNIVVEMIANMRAVKPRRRPEQSAQERRNLNFIILSAD